MYISKYSSVYFLFQNNQICYVEVWDRPWLHLREVTNVTCSSASGNTATTSETRSKRVCIAFVVLFVGARHSTEITIVFSKTGNRDLYIQQLHETKCSRHES